MTSGTGVRDGRGFSGAVAEMLARHGLPSSGWRVMSHDGYSGAQLYRGHGRVLKRSRPQDDWIMAATGDVHGRESRLAGTAMLRAGPVRSAAVDGARTGDEHWTLARDVSAHLLTGVVGASDLRAVLGRVADLHAGGYRLPPEYACPLRERLLLLTRGVQGLAGRRDPHGLLDAVRLGWELFDRSAPPAVTSMIRGLRHDPGALLAALDRLPACALHGDLKLDNIGLDGDGVCWLIDWALAARGPACLDLGWFVAANADRAALSPQGLLDEYSTAAGLHGATRARHEALTVLCGLLLRGWRKALDVEETGRTAEFAWWCERAAGAAWAL